MLNQMLKEVSYLDVPFAEVISNHEVRNGYSFAQINIPWVCYDNLKNCPCQKKNVEGSHTGSNSELMDKEMQHVMTTDLSIWTTFVGSWSGECGSNFLHNPYAKATQSYLDQ